jgi:hypothetical protein
MVPNVFPGRVDKPLMENRPFQGFARNRLVGRSPMGVNHQTPGVRWLNQHSPLSFGPEFVRSEKPTGIELLSVAHATMNWWEKHKDDLIIEDGRKIRRYEFKPSFVSHAQEILKSAAR